MGRAALRGEYTAVAAILLLATLLRLPWLSHLPEGLFRDELEKGYTALELLKTARHGVLAADGIAVSRPMPLFIEVYQGHDRTSAIYQYMTIPFVGLLGLSAWSTRIVAALAGIEAVIATWTLGRTLGGRVVGLLAAGVLATSPAAVIFSRWAQQGILVLPLALLGFWLLERATSEERRDTRNSRAIAVAGAIALGLAAYAYDPARLVVPAMVAVWLATRTRATVWGNRRALLPAAVVFAAIAGGLLAYTLGAGSSRLGRVSVFSDGITAGLGVATGNYFAHLSPLFLFVFGDDNARHGLPGCGVLGPACSLLVGLGLIRILFDFAGRKSREARTGLLLLGWFLVAPLAAALTRDGIPHALRANMLIATGALLAGWGAAWAFEWGANRGRQVAAVAALSAVLAVDAGWAIGGLSRLGRVSPAAWERGVQSALSTGLRSSGQVYLSAEVPYASYAALFAEATEPSRYHELGMKALRTLIVPPGAPAPTAPGDTLVAPPRPGLPLDYYNEYVLLYEGSGRIVRPSELPR